MIFCKKSGYGKGDIDRFDWRVRPRPDRNLEVAIRHIERLDGKRSSRPSKYAIIVIKWHKTTS